MRIIRFVLAVSAIVCLAATSTLARDPEKSSRSASTTRSSKGAKISGSKSSASKRKAKAKASRARAEKKAAARQKESPTQLPETGDIDVSGTFWKDLPPEELPSNEGEEADEEPLP
ncbi:MAG: hypothetical protein H0X73_07430 [Chthoniobacterales bacterium]|nr:hypothetical protein [Chthoniobacterales bacterium]